MRSLLASLVCLSLVIPGAASAGIEKAGTTGASFLSVGAGADVLGMGGTTLGFGGGLGAAAWNVAALGNLNFSEYVFSHAALTGESPQDWIAAGGRFGASRTHWGLSALYQGDGTFEGRDASNNVTSNFSASSMALGVQLAQGFGAGSIGVGMKYASEKLGDVTGGGVTFDAGLRLQAGPFGFGAAAQNAFGKMSYSGVVYDFPTNYGAGVAYTIPSSGVTLAVDANFPNAYYTDVRGGVEWRYRDRVALRTGYRKEMNAADGEPMGGPTFGMGAGANGFWLDYGFLTGGASGSGQHRVALTYRPGFLNGGTQEMTTAPEPRVTHVSAPKAARVETAKPEKAVKPSAPVATPKAAVIEAPKVEAAPVKSEAPKAAAPAAVEAPKVTPAAVAPKTVEVPRATPAALAPKTLEAPKPAAPKVIDTPKPAKVEAPKAEAAPAKSEVAPVKTPPAPAKVEAPKAEAAKSVPVETKPVDTKPAVEAPKAESPAPPPAPVVEAPKTPAPSPAPVPAPEKAKEESRPGKVKVKSGESLADIAKRWGNSVPAIMMENNMVSESVKPGQTLKLPPKGR